MYYANVTSKSPASNLNTSPLATALEADNAAQAIKLPLDEASKIPTWVTVPQEPVAVTNSTADPLVAVVGEVPDTVIAAILFLAYEPPEHSVPPPVSEGAAVNQPTSKVPGAV